MIVSILALVFSVLFIFYSRNTGHSFWLVWAPFFLAAAAFVARDPGLQPTARPHVRAGGRSALPDARR